MFSILLSISTTHKKLLSIRKTVKIFCTRKKITKQNTMKGKENERRRHRENESLIIVWNESERKSSAYLPSPNHFSEERRSIVLESTREKSELTFYVIIQQRVYYTLHTPKLYSSSSSTKLETLFAPRVNFGFNFGLGLSSSVSVCCRSRRRHAVFFRVLMRRGGGFFFLLSTARKGERMRERKSDVLSFFLVGSKFYPARFELGTRTAVYKFA